MRRGFLVWYEKYPPFDTFNFPHYGDIHFRSRIADILTVNLAIPTIISALEVLSALESFAASFGIGSVACCDVFAMDEVRYNANIKAIADTPTQPSYDIYLSVTVLRSPDIYFHMV